MALALLPLSPLLLLRLSQPPQPPPPPPQTAAANAPAGTFLGYVDDGTRTWRGIPYAEPPVDDLRWRRTVPARNLTEPLATTSFRADCAQIGPGWSSLGGMIPDCHDYMHGCPNMTWSEETSEDCLYLNVYAPDNSGKEPGPGTQGFPVVVYFPSGAFQWGAANDWENNAYKKSTAPGWNSSVFVTANYRTGIFGFLASESLSKRSGDNSSGLFGIHDQTMVLKWIQRNIAAFGGDPKRVMIFGESAGATSMSLHLVMPESEGLFHAVAIDSGAFNQWTYRSWGDAMDIWENVTKALGCDEWGEPLDCMLEKPKDVLLNVSDAYYGNSTGKSLPHPEAINGTQWGPVVDGNLLPLPPIDMLKRGMLSSPQVPVLLGSNGDEGSTFLSDSVYDQSAFEQWCNHTFGMPFGPTIYEYYSAPQRLKPQPSPDRRPGGGETWENAATSAIGDFVMRCPTRAAARALAEQGHPVFLYNFVHQPAESVNWPSGTQNLGAFHGAEVPFVFHDTFEMVGGETELSDAMSVYWTNMASSGDPNTWAGPTATPPTPAPATSADAHNRHRRGVSVGSTTTLTPPSPPGHNSSHRPANWTHWWHYQGYDCDSGIEEGTCDGSEHDCKAKCLADPKCGGYNSDKHLKKLDCRRNMQPFNHHGQPDPTFELWLLQPTPMPPPPPPRPPYVQLPEKCGLFSQDSQCYHPSSAYRKIAIFLNETDIGGGDKYIKNASSLTKCCAACAADSDATDRPKCKRWFVAPSNRSVLTECLLLTETARAVPNQTNCIGAAAPLWIPPPQCHSMFTPLKQWSRVNFTQMPPSPPSHHGYPHPTRKVLHNKTLAECCEACYMDYQGESPCRTWDMPDNSSGVCNLYGGYGLPMIEVDHSKGQIDSYRGADRHYAPPPPPPAPPSPCVSPQPLNGTTLPHWPQYDSEGKNNIKFDICNITTEVALEEDVCQKWDVWLPAGSAQAQRVMQVLGQVRAPPWALHARFMARKALGQQQGYRKQAETVPSN